MVDNEKVFAFDVGKASLGICARQGSKILALESLLIPAEFASTQEFRGRRRALRTREAHKKREQWLRQKWQEAGLVLLDSNNERLKREFPQKGDSALYNSSLLRIALLQEQPLEAWQIFKALWSSIQHRGYDPTCDWKPKGNQSSSAKKEPQLETAVVSDEEKSDSQKQQEKDEKENLESLSKYQDDIGYHTGSLPEYQYPCYLEASLMKLWSIENPTVFNNRIGCNAGKVRSKGRVAPRELVTKEIRQLFENAKKQLPELRIIDTEELLFGPAKIPYASQYKSYAQYRGSEWDAQGVLSQKVPRFDNRIIAKCQLMPMRNVCKASDPAHYRFVLLSKLKTLRFTFTDEDGEIHNRGLLPSEFTQAYEKAKEVLARKKATEITFIQTGKDILNPVIGTPVSLINLKAGEKLKINTSGRSRFCRPALEILNTYLLAGKDPHEFDITPYIKSDDYRKGITREEVETLISRLGKSWEKFQISDNRDERKLIAQGNDAEREIQKVVASCNNPVVRHRLMVFWNELKKLATQYGKPDKIILEFPRGGEGLEGHKTAADWESSIKRNERANDELRRKLEEAGLPVTKNNILRMKLYVEQRGVCPYTGNKLSDSNLSYYDIDHIVPVSNNIATDSIFNTVLCLPEANRDKQNQTSYEWLHETDQWHELLERVTNKDSAYSSKKRQLLTRSDARELIDSYNGLAETAYVARLAQEICALQFGWGLQTANDQRRIFVCDGKVTAKIRRIYKLNELLLSDKDKQMLLEAKNIGEKRSIWKKNRENKKHHAVDAYVISYSQRFKLQRVSDDGKAHWHAPELELSKFEFEQKLNALFPHPTRRNTKELYPLETIYGYKKRMENGKEIHYLTVRKNLSELLGKDRKKIKDIYDLEIRKDLLANSEAIQDNAEWLSFLKTYKHPYRKSKVKTVVIIETFSTEPPQKDEKGRLCFGEYKDFGNLDSENGLKGITKGQFKHSKQHKGQVIYFDKKGKTKVWPIYSHTSLTHIVKLLKSQGYQLYKDGLLFYAGSLVKVTKSFKAGSNIYSEGIYKLRTIFSAGPVKLENGNGQEILTSIAYLVEAGFELLD
ncbi:MAG: HNH endonuclease domain-containing protein [Vampirovibrionales bacterium]|nr:HNH endonuclease domain-containing protein [Vampirovibrionales bacterium]